MGAFLDCWALSLSGTLRFRDHGGQARCQGRAQAGSPMRWLPGRWRWEGARRSARRIGLVLEGEAFVELGERKLDPDLGQGKNRIGDEDVMRPPIARVRVDGGADAVLLEHDVALDGGGGLIFPRLDEPVWSRR